MLDKATIDDLAERLDKAERERSAIDPFSQAIADRNLDDAYAIQRAWVAKKLAAGRVAKGHKIGLTSKAMQAVANIKEPDYGVLFDDMFFADGAAIPVDRFIEPRLECELAFILAKPLKGPNITLFDVLDATAYVSPALELVDLRIRQLDPVTKAPRTIYDTIADNAANAGIILGGRPVRPDAVDLRWIGAAMYRNGVIEETGLSAGVMNHPAHGIVWLANKLADFDVVLEPGEVLLAGSFTRTVLARRGDTFHVDYGPLGNITCSFV